MAEHHGPVVFVSMELTDVDLAVRLVSVLTNTKKEHLVVGRLTDGQQEQVHAAVERLEQSRLYIVAGSGFTTGDVRAHLLRTQAATGCHFAADNAPVSRGQSAPGCSRPSAPLAPDRCSAGGSASGRGHCGLRVRRLLLSSTGEAFAVTNRRTLTMDVQEVVRLVRDGASDREITALVGLNRRTVGRYRRWATQQNLLQGPLPSVSDLQQVLAATLPVQLPPQQTSSVTAYEEQIVAYRRQGLELAAIRPRLEEQHGVPISYDAIWRLVRRLEQSQLPETFVRVEVPPGSEAQVDFGYAGLQIDPATGRLRTSWVFVLVLAFSRHTYAEVVFDQRAARVAAHRRRSGRAQPSSRPHVGGAARR